MAPETLRQQNPGLIVARVPLGSRILAMEIGRDQYQPILGAISIYSPAIQRGKFGNGWYHLFMLRFGWWIVMDYYSPTHITSNAVGFDSHMISQVFLCFLMFATWEGRKCLFVGIMTETFLTEAAGWCFLGYEGGWNHRLATGDVSIGALVEWVMKAEGISRCPGVSRSRKQDLKFRHEGIGKEVQTLWTMKTKPKWPKCI